LLVGSAIALIIGTVCFVMQAQIKKNRYNGYMVRDPSFLPNPPAKPEGRLANIVNSEFDPHDGPELKTEITIYDVEEETPLSEDTEPGGSGGEVATKGARRFHADTPFVLSLLLFLIASMAAASFYISFSGLYSAAAWAVGDNPPLQFAVPIMLDISIIAFTLALFIERERGEKVLGTWLAIGAFTLVSITANVFHTFVVSTAVDQYQLIIGAVISGGAPLLLAFGVDKIAIKVFKRTSN